MELIVCFAALALGAIMGYSIAAVLSCGAFADEMETAARALHEAQVRKEIMAWASTTLWDLQSRNPSDPTDMDYPATMRSLSMGLREDHPKLRGLVVDHAKP